MAETGSERASAAPPLPDNATPQEIARRRLLAGETDNAAIARDTGLNVRQVAGIKGQLVKSAVLKEEEETGPPLPAEDQMRKEMRGVLETELSILPGTTEGGRASQYILNRFDTEDTYHRDPMQLHYLVNRLLPKADSLAIQDLVNRVFSVTLRYNLRSSSAQPFYNPYQQQGYGPAYPQGPYCAYPPYQQSGYGQPPQGQPRFYTDSDVAAERKRWEAENNERKLVEQITELSRKVEQIASGGGSGGQAYVVEETVNADGSKVVRRIPVSQAAQDPTMKVLTTLKEMGWNVGGGQGITKDDVRTIVREESPGGEPPYITDLKNQLVEQKKNVEDLKGQMETNRYNQLMTMITNLQTQISRGDGSGWKSDEGRIIGEGMKELAGAIKENKPLTQIRQTLTPPSTASKAVEPQAGEGLETRIDPKYIQK